MKYIFLFFLIFLVSCTSIVEFEIGEIYLGSYHDNIFQKNIYSPNENTYVMIDYINGLKISNNQIQPQVIIKIQELNYE